MILLSMNTVGVGTQLAITNESKMCCKSAEFSKHSESLFPLIEEIMKEAKVNVNELSAVGVVTGPGSFTGIRIGMSVAKVMSFARNIPVVGVSALEVLAYNVIFEQLPNKGIVCATINAGGNRLYYQFFEIRDGVLFCITEPSLMKIEHLEGYIDRFYPDAIVLYNASNEKLIDNMSERFVESEFLAESLAMSCENNYRLGNVLQHNEVMPMYIRDSQAEVVVVRNKENIEYLTKSDILVEELMFLENQGDSEYVPWNIKMLSDFLDNKDCDVIVARYGEKLLGYLAYRKVVDEYEIERVVVFRGARLQGIARCLLEELARLASMQNIGKILLEVNERNYPAYRLYSSVGFIQDGIRKDYYGEGKNAILMSMKI